MTNAEKLARQFHATYESLAPQFGYETRTETREFDPTTPNGQLMIAVCERLIGDGAKLPEEVRRCLMALRLELPPDIVNDVQATIETAWGMRPR